MSRIVSFRGLLADGAQERIALQTITGLIGYRITKFELMPEKAGTTEYECTIKIYKVPQTTVTESVDFSDNRLLAAAYTEGRASSDFIGQPLITIFDNEIFNQDIHITHIDTLSDKPCNYYIELEQMKLDLSEQTVATLKDIRNVGAD